VHAPGHILHYWPGTQKFLNPRTGRAPLLGSFDRLYKRFAAVAALIPVLVYCSLLWVHVPAARARRGEGTHHASQASDLEADSRRSELGQRLFYCGANRAMTKATRVTRGPCGRRRPFPACLVADGGARSWPSTLRPPCAWCACAPPLFLAYVRLMPCASLPPLAAVTTCALPPHRFAALAVAATATTAAYGAGTSGGLHIRAIYALYRGIRPSRARAAATAGGGGGGAAAVAAVYFNSSHLFLHLRSGFFVLIYHSYALHFIIYSLAK
jgi:hypothetical protein